jgi:hypothetical protein
MAMAKLSMIELKAGNAFDANVWAQIYGHYELDGNGVGSPMSSNFVAMIVLKAFNGLPKDKYEALDAAVGTMFTRYDAQIRKGMKAMADNSSAGPWLTRDLPTAG